MTQNLRIALMGTVTATALMAVASPASAQSCTINPVAVPTSTINCAAGATTDTVNAGAALALDRQYNVTTAGGNSVTTVSGALTGNGLAIINTVPGANTLSFVNNGSVTVDATATPTVGGTGAVVLEGMGATNVLYSGNGNITNLGLNGDALTIRSAGTGNLTANIGGNLTAGTTGAGALVASTGTAGNVNVSTATGTTVRAKSYGLYGQINNALSTGNVTVSNGATVGSLTGAPNTLTSGVLGATAGTGSVTVSNSGAIGSTTDRITTFGLGAATTNALNSSAIRVDNTGTVYSNNVGIIAINAGTGTTTVTNGAGTVNATNAAISATGTTGALNVTTGTGAVTATAPTGVGILVNNGTGPVTVTTGTGAVSGGMTGIQSVSTGTQAFTVNGALTGTATAGLHSDTTGNRTITIGTGGNVTGGAEAILLTNTGTATITNNGTIGGASTGLAVMGSTAGATTINNGTSTTAAGTLNGRLMLGAGNDTLSNYGTFNTQGISDFGAGTDTLINRAGGTINLTGATAFTGLETFTQGGRLNLNTYTLTGTGAFTNAAGGTIDTNGAAGLAGFTSFSNAGTLDLAAGTFTAPAGAFTNSGTIIADEGASTITGQTSFTNTGLINLVDNAANDTLTINSSFIGGTGSRLAVDVSDTAADRLVVTGAISGSTAVDANLLGTGALAGGGVQFVDGQSTSTPNAFTLGNVMGGSALVNYSVVQQGSDYYLDTSLNQAGFRPLSLAAAAVDFWYPSADEVIANLAVPYKGEGIGFWADGYYSREKYGDRDADYSFGGVNYTVDQRVKFSHMGLQGGVDYGMGETGRVGITAGYSRHDGKGSTNLDAKGWNVGLYGAFGGMTGFHGEALAKYDRYKVGFNDNFFDGYDPKVRSFGLDGSLGYRIPMGGEMSSLDLAAGLSHVTSKIDDINAYGLRYDYDRVKSTRGRASARYNLGGDLQPYVQATAYHEFAKPGNVGLFDGADTYSLATAKRGTWGRIEGGLGGSPGRFPSLAAWADFGDVKGIGARLGMRFGGRSAPAPEPLPAPAPAPAPEPAPATQTCYDGSVILATDTCPLPPAPPPPAPAPERG